MPRKGENIYKRKDGRWEGRYIKSRTPAGKANYGYVYAKRIERSNRNLLTKSHSQVILPLPIKKCLLSVLNVLPWNGFRLYTHR